VRGKELSSFLREVHAFVIDDGSFLFFLSFFLSRGGVWFFVLNSFTCVQGISPE